MAKENFGHAGSKSNLALRDQEQHVPCVYITFCRKIFLAFHPDSVGRATAAFKIVESIMTSLWKTVET